jgi:hypothetical protein
MLAQAPTFFSWIGNNDVLDMQQQRWINQLLLLQVQQAQDLMLHMMLW